ncbi:MAG: hypothetical protein HY917_05775 [Candidatus Diapherotrites archaeon]|nr:hypothetical protein [Candidatus Diapherotrites archaeon]
MFFGRPQARREAMQMLARLTALDFASANDLFTVMTKPKGGAVPFDFDEIKPARPGADYARNETRKLLFFADVIGTSRKERENLVRIAMEHANPAVRAEMEKDWRGKLDYEEKRRQDEKKINRKWKRIEKRRAEKEKLPYEEWLKLQQRREKRKK